MVGDVYGSRWVFWRWERGMRREACGLWIRVLRGLDGKRLVGGWCCWIGRWLGCCYLHVKMVVEVSNRSSYRGDTVNM